MNIFLNGREKTITAETTLALLLSGYGLPKERVVIEVNENAVSRALFETTTVQEGDRVEILEFVGGG